MNDDTSNGGMLTVELEVRNEVSLVEFRDPGRGDSEKEMVG